MSYETSMTYIHMTSSIASGDGIKINGYSVNNLSYADDAIVITNSEEDL